MRGSTESTSCWGSHLKGGSQDVFQSRSSASYACSETWRTDIIGPTLVQSENGTSTVKLFTEIYVDITPQFNNERITTVLLE